MQTRRRKLLLADDSPAIQKVISLTFMDEGFEVVTVGAGDEAVRELEQTPPPDIVLADIFMPHINGYELCRHIKRDERFQHIPVLLLVGTFEPYNETEARRVGADDVVTKPFQSIRDLVSKVGSLLGGGASRSDENSHEADAATHQPGAPATSLDDARQASDDRARDARTQHLEPAASTSPLPWSEPSITSTGSSEEADRHELPVAESAAEVSFAETDMRMDDQMIEERPVENPDDETPIHVLLPDTDEEEETVDAEMAEHAEIDEPAHAFGDSFSQEEPAVIFGDSFSHEEEAPAEPSFALTMDDESEVTLINEPSPFAAINEPSPFAVQTESAESFAAHNQSAESFALHTPSAESFAAHNQSVESSEATMLGGDDALLDLDNVGAQPQSASRFAADESDDFILDLDDEFAPATPARASSFASGQWEANRGSRAESPSATAVADAPPTERPAAEASAGRSLGLPAQSFSEIDAAGAFAEAAHGQTSTSAADDEMPTLVASSAPSFAASAAPFAAETFSVEPQAEAGFDQPMQPSSGRASLDESGASSGASGASSGTSPAATLGGQSIGVEQLSPEAIDAIARRVVEQLSERVIREIAWEVVPELAELLIKKRLEEQG